MCTDSTVQSTTLILLLGEPTAYRKGVDLSGRAAPKEERISCAVPHRVKLPSGELIDDVFSSTGLGHLKVNVGRAIPRKYVET